MNNKIISIICLLLLLPALSWGACTGSSPTWTSTPDRTSVASCVTNATAGDTINISAGAEEWSSGINITKRLNIIGAGKTSTVITYTGSGNYAFNFSANDWRLSAIGFILPYNNIIMVRADGLRWRIDHCRYINNSVANGESLTGSSRCFIIAYGRISDGYSTGVIDNNEIINGRIFLASYMSTAAQNAIWAETFAIGSAGDGNAVYIEDNTVTRPDDGYPKNIVDMEYGARGVVRYNTIDGEYISVHSFSTDGNRGVKFWEIYGNTIANTKATEETGPFYIGAGTGVVFNNSIAGTWSVMNGAQLGNDRSIVGSTSDNTTTAGRCDGDNAYDGNTSGQSGWPCRDQIGRGQDASLLTPGSTPYPAQESLPAYFWSNIYGGSHVESGVSGGESTWITENRDYYEYNASCTSSSCSSGVGCGSATPTGSCTTGTAYWKTNQSCTNMTGMVGANPSTPISGTLYKCTATNTWTSYYTPYEYPHPLRGESGGGSYVVTISKSGDGTGTVTEGDDHINCGTECSYTYYQYDGQEVTFTATPATGMYFSGWTGGCVGTGLTCTTTISGDATITASFTNGRKCSLGAGGGTITVGP